MERLNEPLRSFDVGANKFPSLRLHRAVLCHQLIDRADTQYRKIAVGKRRNIAITISVVFNHHVRLHWARIGVSDIPAGRKAQLAQDVARRMNTRQGHLRALLNAWQTVFQKVNPMRPNDDTRINKCCAVFSRQHRAIAFGKGCVHLQHQALAYVTRSDSRWFKR